MKSKCLVKTRALLSILSFAPILSGAFAAEPKTAMAMTTAPVFDEPAQGLLARGFIGKRDTCEIDSTVVDSTGAAWFHIRESRGNGARKSGGWIAAGAVRYASDIPQNFTSRDAAGDADKKRRLEILKKHPDWPRRVIGAVRSGRICLDMTEEQVVAAWGAPAERHKSYMVGIGDYFVFLYKSVDKGLLGVMMQNDRVMGWTTDE
jgi:hypothetical protein